MVELLGYSISTDLPKIPQSKIVVNTINPHSFCVAKKDMDFKNALIDSNYIIPDGSGIVLAAKVIKGKSIKKIAGADLHDYLLEYLNNMSGKVFYLGASQNTLDLIRDKIKKEYPKISVQLYSPPFKQKFSESDNIAMRKRVNDFKPDVLFVGMTAPKQEKWVHANKKFLDVGVIASIGAVFDFYAGTVKRPGSFWISLGLEWLPRLVREPKRLWRRNFVSSPLFIYYILKEKLVLKLKK